MSKSFSHRISNSLLPIISQLDSMIAAVKVESSALDSMKEKLREVENLRNQVCLFVSSSYISFQFISLVSILSCLCVDFHVHEAPAGRRSSQFKPQVQPGEGAGDVCRGQEGQGRGESPLDVIVMMHITYRYVSFLWTWCVTTMLPNILPFINMLNLVYCTIRCS